MTDDRCPHGHPLSGAESVAASHTQPVLVCHTCNTLYYPDGIEAPDMTELKVAVEHLIRARRPERRGIVTSSEVSPMANRAGRRTERVGDWSVGG